MLNKVTAVRQVYDCSSSGSVVKTLLSVLFCSISAATNFCSTDYLPAEIPIISNVIQNSVTDQKVNEKKI